MKIAVYKIDRVSPKDADEEADFCEMLNLPSLKYGYAEFVGEFSHFVTKPEAKKLRPIWSKFYSRKQKCWIEGAILLAYDKKMFAVNLR